MTMNLLRHIPALDVFLRPLTALGWCCCLTAACPVPLHAGDIRPAAQAGRFYEADGALLRQQVTAWLDAAAAEPAGGTVALIVPHAGHRWSGSVAAAAYRTLQPARKYRRIFLIGPSHHEALDRASVDTGFSAWASPLGPVRLDTAVCRALAADPLFAYSAEAFSEEHCLEVQVPFLQVRLDEMPPIVPVLINTGDGDKLVRMAKALLPYFNEEDNLFVISSDFSHYLAFDDACRIDALTGGAVASGNLQTFLQVLSSNAAMRLPGFRTSCCGEASVAVLMMMLGDKDEISHLLYKNSGHIDAAQRQQVVGYHAFTVQRHEGFWLSNDNKMALREMAMQSIEHGFNQETWYPDAVSPVLTTGCGAFVTLRQKGELRGCIGHIGEDLPLWMAVCRMARSAAFEDSRFTPLRKSELKRTDLEISVLTPARRIDDVTEFIPGKHGILIIKDGHRGTYLPQVADETGWSREEMLQHCAADKAGLGPDGWKDAELYIYETIVF